MLALQGVDPAAPAEVRYRVSNSFDEPIFIQRCGDRIAAGLEPLVNGEFQLASPGICPANVSTVALRLEAGATVVDSMAIGAAGEYRLRIGYGRGVTRVLHTLATPAFVVE